MKTHWTTKDGRRVLVSKMTDVHLDNTIAMLKRIEEPEEQYYSGDSYYAEALVEQENRQNSMLWNEIQDWIEVLCYERMKRNL